MSESALHRAAPERVVTALLAGIGDRLLCGAALLTLISSGEAYAAEPPSTGALQADRGIPPRVSFTAPAFASVTGHAYTLSDPLLTAPSLYKLPEMPEEKTFSSKDFRPRGRSLFDVDPRLGAPDDITVDKTMWQRWREYKNHDRVRVLTLWETGASAISLQTNRKGDPSLQWTSRLMNRGGASQGLLDRLFPVSVFGGTTHVTRSPTSQPSRVSGALSALRFGNATPP
jgi:hypothetical protein